MVFERLNRLRSAVEGLFPERHVYVRSGGELHAHVLTTGRQVAIAGGGAALLLWMGVATAAVLIQAVSPSAADRAAAQTRAYDQRLIADREARLNSAVAQLSDSNGSLSELAKSVESRHQALAMLLTAARGEPGAAAALAPTPIDVAGGANPLAAVHAVENDQDRLINQAETFAKSRADRLRLAFRLAGLDPSAFSRVDGDSLGGPLIEQKDPRALAAVLDVDEEFAQRIQHAATEMSDLSGLSSTAQDLPLAKPTSNTRQASGFGVRVDPFTGAPAFHPGLDFAGPIGTPVAATAPGVISFTGWRNGYGNTIEIDHGHGLKTRFGHLSRIDVRVGDRVAIGTHIGAIGSTGRSTGPHLHYEVWVDGRPQNPERFLEAGDYVQQQQQATD